MFRHAYLAIDMAGIGIATVLAFVIRDTAFSDVVIRPGLGLYLVLTLVFTAVCFSAFGVSRRMWRYFSFYDVFQLALVSGFVVLLTSVAAFLIDRADLIPRSIPPLQWVLIMLVLIGGRSIVRLTAGPQANASTPVRDHWQPVKHVLLVGTNDVAELYLRCVRRLSEGSISVAGILDEDPLNDGIVLKSARVIGRPESIVETVNAKAIQGVHISQVVVAVPFSSLSERSREALRQFEKISGCELEMFDERLGFAPPRPSAETVRATQFEADKQRSPVAEPQRLYPSAKRLLDIVLSFALIVLLLPLMTLIWFIVQLDVGAPAYFWQVRPGYRGKEFRVVKFRTMRAAHDIDGNRMDDRVRSSKIGNFLRHYRLDELPQLFNILKGDMSFIGPRPLLPVDQPEARQVRLSVRPGLSGWAQINGGRVLTSEDKAALDAWYIQNVSFWLDIKIAIGTIVVLWKGDSPPRADVIHQARNLIRRTAV